MRKLTFLPVTQAAQKEKSVYSQKESNLSRCYTTISYRKLVGAKATKVGCVWEI